MDSPTHRADSERSSPGGRRVLLVGVAFLVVTAAAYLPVLDAGWVWDDNEHVVSNANLRSWEGLARTWLEPRSLPQYYPLVHTTFWLEYQIWGAQPRGYHVVNVLLHAAAAGLVFLVLRRLGVPGALLAACVFALHPVHVESVAWVTERKNVLSAVLYLAAALALLRYFRVDGSDDAPEGQREGDRGLWWAALFSFVGALLSKTVTASLPAALVLLLWWKKRPVGRREVAALAPFFALGLAFGLTTVWLEREHVGAEGLDWALTSTERLLVAGRAPWFYLGKVIWPVDLAFIYPRWVIDASDPRQHLILFATVAAGLSLWLLRARIGRGPFVAAAFFVGTLAPVLGFFNVYPMRFSFVADHFQYLASLGPIALLSAGAVRIGRRAPWLFRGVAVVVVLLLGSLTSERAEVYRDARTLWRDTLIRNPECWLCLNNLGAGLARDGRAGESLPLLAEALRLRPGSVEARVNLGVSLTMAGRPEEALRQYDAILGAHPDHSAALYNRGLALGRLGRLDEAAQSFGRIVGRTPGHALAQEGLGRALALQGRHAEAVEPLRLGLAAHPGDAEARRELAFVLTAAGQPAEAEEFAREALAIDPDAGGARLELARALAGQGDYEGACREAEEILRQDPGNTQARQLLAGDAPGP